MKFHLLSFWPSADGFYLVFCGFSRPCDETRAVFSISRYRPFGLYEAPPIRWNVNLFGFSKTWTLKEK